MTAVDGEQTAEPSVANGFTLTAVGDCISSRVLAPLLGADESFAAAIAVLRGGDVAFGNLETGVFDIRGFDGHQRTMDDWAIVGPPAVARDLRHLGFNLMGRANNHSLDWSISGMRQTSRWLDEASIVHAGVGETLAQARAPRYLETSRGRVGLVSFHTTTRLDQAQALDQFGQVPPRPGFNPLRLQTKVTVDDAVLRGLREVDRVLHLTGTAISPRPEGQDLDLLGLNFGSGAGTAVEYAPFPDDLDALCRAVRLGKQHSDFLVVSAHVHEEGPDPDTQPAFLVDVAHALVDAGADAFIGHGVHRLWPVEMYRGRLICYGLGNFFFHDILEPVTQVLYEDARGAVDADATDADVTRTLSGPDFDSATYYESLLVSMTVAQGHTAEVRLHPMTLGFGERLTRRGIPHLASDEAGHRILERVTKSSHALGTRIEIRDGLAVIQS